MNALNYASIEASRRLVDNGIVLDTEVFRYKDPGEEQTNGDFIGEKDWELHRKYLFHPRGMQNYPAPSMAEVWRELPPGTELHKHHSYSDALHFADSDNADSEYPSCNSINPTDALINLLIWVRK
uniref:Uncharacterized protein n=1 Tax=viral metagenome TaxID=1070528 RepID=A0A6M3JLE5_9ZZZZ